LAQIPANICKEFQAHEKTTEFSATHNLFAPFCDQTGISALLISARYKSSWVYCTGIITDELTMSSYCYPVMCQLEYSDGDSRSLADDFCIFSTLTAR